MSKSKLDVIDGLRASRAAKLLSRIYRPAASAVLPAYELLSLEPEYDEASHRMYSDLLIHQLEKSGEAAPRSLALTGPYGSGKSSVIDYVKKHFGNRAISISLPTLGDGVIDEKRDTAQSTTTSRMSKTNVVQKEIVKQLLYIEKPSKMRGSRFQRIAPMRWGLAIAASAAVSITATIVLYATSALATVVELLPHYWISAWAVHLGALMALSVLVLVLFSALHSRVALAEVGSGSASIKLTSANTNYFDEYLDEVVYFFERTAVDIVIFEDLDRFNEPHIFETLKELNTLLNGSKQLRRKKTIRFVYAVRDSIFDLQRAPGATNVGDGSERAKFFGAIVPLVPFITHRSSAALLLDILGETAPKNSLLIETVASHLTDMRLIKNIRNEWEVFRRRILSDDGLTGLDPDKLFAMVVYKNLHPADFEKIRSASSLLDVAFRASIELVRQNSKRLTDEASDLVKRSKLESAVSRAGELGIELHLIITQMMERFKQSKPQDYQTAGTTYTPDSLGTLAFWRGLASAGATLTVRYPVTRNYNQFVAVAEFTAEEITALLKTDIDPDRWEKKSRDELQRAASHVEDERAQLESLTFGELLRSGSNYKVYIAAGDRRLVAHHADIGTEAISFDALISILFDDPAAVDLLRAELIDLNFTLYTSEFKDAKISAPAMTYFIQFVQKNESNLVYKFKHRDDIKSLVEYAGVPALEGRAFYNVEIVDYLLTAGDNKSPIEAIGHLTSTLASGTPMDREFVREFVDRSDNAVALIREMAQFDRDLFAWLGATYGDDPRLPVLTSAALRGAANRSYSTNTQLRELFASIAPTIPALVEPVPVATSLAIATALQQLEVEIADLQALGANQRSAVIKRHLFSISEANLRSAAPGSDLSLDQMRKDDQPLAEHVLANLEKYLDIVTASGGAIVSIRESDRYVDVLEWVHERRPDRVQQVAELASPGCSVDLIDEVAEHLWAPLARSGRIRPTLTNIKSLKEASDRAAVTSSDLEQLLARVPRIEIDTKDELFAIELRMLLLRSGAVTPEQKVTLISNLGIVEPLKTTDVEADGSDLVARLTETGLLPDTAETFNHLNGHPSARAAFIARSSSFTSYIAHVQLELSDLKSIAKDESIGDNVREALLWTNGSLARGDKAVADALLEFARANGSSVQSLMLARALELGSSRDLVFELIPININNRTAEGLNAILKGLGGEYAKLAAPGRGVAKLPDDPSHHEVIKRLQKVGFAGKIAANFSPTGKMIVNRKRGAGSSK